MKEVWLDVVGFEGLYKISNLGRVKSIERKTKYKNSFRTVKERMLKTSLNGGYKKLQLSKNGKTTTYKLHRLLAEAFLNHKPNRYKIVVDHIDNNPLNNNLDNLQLITHRQNIVKDTKRGTSKYVGVQKIGDKFRARIRIGKNNKSLGTFRCELKASYVYNKALKNLI